MAKTIQSDSIDKFFEYGIDIANRTIYLGSATYDESGGESGVDFLMADRYIKGLHILDKMAPNGDKPITVLANNPGGDWHHGMSMYGFTKSCSNEIVFHLFGYAMSMGSIIPLAADEVYIDKEASFMIHYGQDAHVGHSKTAEKWADESKRLNHRMENIYLEKILLKDKRQSPEILEKVLTDIINRQNELQYPKVIKETIKLPTSMPKREEALRKVLTRLLNFDSILTPQETVDLGFAKGIL